MKVPVVIMARVEEDKENFYLELPKGLVPLDDYDFKFILSMKNEEN